MDMSTVFAKSHNPINSLSTDCLGTRLILSESIIESESQYVSNASQKDRTLRPLNRHMTISETKSQIYMDLSQQLRKENIVSLSTDLVKIEMRQVI